MNLLVTYYKNALKVDINIYVVFLFWFIAYLLLITIAPTVFASIAFMLLIYLIKYFMI